MKSNKSVKAMLGDCSTGRNKMRFNGEAKCIEAYLLGYGMLRSWQKWVWVRPVSLDASGNIQAASKG